MRILMLVLVLIGTAHGPESYDERSNRIGRTDDRQGRIEVHDAHSNRIGGGVRQPDSSIDVQDPQGNRIGRTGSRLTLIVLPLLSLVLLAATCHLPAACCAS